MQGCARERCAATKSLTSSGAQKTNGGKRINALQTQWESNLKIATSVTSILTSSDKHTESLNLGGKMKISELIEKLEELKEAHGDLDVEFQHCDDGWATQGSEEVTDLSIASRPQWIENGYYPKIFVLIS